MFKIKNSGFIVLLIVSLVLVVLAVCLLRYACDSGDMDGDTSDMLDMEGSTSLLSSSSRNFLLLPHNSGKKITKEINSPEVRRLLRKIAGPVVDRVSVRVHLSKVGSLQIGCWWLEDHSDDFSSEVIGAYVYARAEGHSYGYAKQLLRETYVEQSSGDAKDDRDAITKQFPRVSKAWLKEHPFEELHSYVNDGKTYHSYVIIEKPLAWVYTIEKKPDGRIIYIKEDKLDSQEVDPTLKHAFDAASIKAKLRLKREGIEGFGSVHSYWDYLKTILKEEYDIDWKNPQELSPDTFFD